MQEIHDSRKKDTQKVEQRVTPKTLTTTVNEKPKPILSIHDSRKKGISSWPLSKRIILFFHNNKKTIKWVIIIGFILVLLLFPVWTGTMIGTWIKDFIGTIINIVKTI